jgi:hypothetical protein
MGNKQNNNTDQGEKEKKKVILLDLSRTERAFEETESLWDIEIEKIEERLAGHIASLEVYKNEKDFREKPMLSIAILGYPGSGKTSMLRTLVKRVNQGKLKKKDLNSSVCSLPVIKPNLVVEGDHFLYAFLAEALREDRSQRPNQEDQDRETPFISRVQHKFQEVSEYLQVLNEAGHKHEGDPLGVSLERLERHESGLMLIEKMAGFIDELANSLGTNTQPSVVLLPVDDADMSKEVLISALDTCWRFIRHPRLVPIFTFTGRLAEELLRVHYDEKINSGSSSEKLKEAATSLLVTENMALQYLGRLFPVRNRIKMGLAAARVQAAEYRPLKSNERENEKKKKVSELLKTASRLLFGHAHEPIAHPIRPPLRVVTLRRQIQIIDAIQGVGIDDFIENDSENDTKSLPKTTHTDGDNGDKDKKEKRNSWGRIYDLTSWSLLNAHRDVLKEINLNLDDLYSWTPKGLRQVVLDCLLMQDVYERGKLLKHWRYRTEDRRSQIISLLAANVFRPLMAEEPTGDDSTEVIENWWKEYTANKGNCSKLDHDSFSSLAGALWFLNLCIGFYLPLMLAWKKLGKTGEKEEGNRVTGIGWDLLNGPAHAVREALNNKKVFSSGILFLDPEEFNNALEDTKPNKYKRFLIHVWCSYGFHEGWPWAAISLWRGLGLIGKIIEFYETHQKCGNDKNDLIKSISEIILKHFGSALVSGYLPKGGKIEKYEDFKFEDWEYKDETKEGEDSMEKLVPNFSEALFIWLDKNYFTLKNKKEENRIHPMQEGKDRWGKCFIRRLHGESIMSIFWQDLDNAYYKKELGNWSAGLILYRWKKLLSQYWEGCDKIKNLLESCPIWPDYRSHDLYEKGDTEFDWDTVKVYPLAEYKEKDKKNINKLEEEKKKLEEEKKKPVEESNMKDVEKNIKELEKNIKKLEKKNEGTYDKIAVKKYGDNMNILRADFENYLLFSDEKKSTKHNLEGDLNITYKDKKTNGDAEKKNESNDKGKKGTGENK